MPAGRKIGHRVSSATKKKISDGMKRHHAKGGHGNHSKVMVDDRPEIVALYHQGDIPVEVLAKMYNISTKHLYSIINLLEGMDDE